MIVIIGSNIDIRPLRETGIRWSIKHVGGRSVTRHYMRLFTPVTYLLVIMFCFLHDMQSYYCRFLLFPIPLAFAQIVDPYLSDLVDVLLIEARDRQ